MTEVTFPCVVKDCPWEASLKDGMWVCEKHDQSEVVFDEESKVVWPKIAEMDRRIREATERMIRSLHQNENAFEMFLDLTQAALGYEKTVTEMEKNRPKKPVKHEGGINL